MSQQMANLVAWSQMALVWGPLIPALYALLLLTLASNLIVYVIAVYMLGVSSKDAPGTDGGSRDPPRVSRSFLALIIAFSWLMSTWFAVEAGFSSRWLLYALPVGVFFFHSHLKAVWVRQRRDFQTVRVQPGVELT